MEIFSLQYWQDFALKYGIYGLAFNSFIEAIFFPIPPDVLLITLCVADPQNAFLYAFIATLFSSFGGVGGYYLGYFGGKPLAFKLFGEDKVKKVHRLYESYEGLIVLLAGFTPIPYKVFTVTSGILFASLKKLIVFSIVGRGLRFFSEAALFYFYGAQVKHFVLHNLNILFTVLGVFLIVGFLVYRRYKKGRLP
ncbi:YqaA family protein [Desulfurobacterium thermolithotrophum]|uniref:YqaA family protein n=1 Tax=Desulfurobacterium thermolithotrophum TaxID=64160 RepID=UPI0013D85486|nr:VTT domain-containing protein [Desulfurobacterium thermolithotrophum]